MNILFLFTGRTSFDEAIIASQFIDQLSEEHDISCLSQMALGVYFDSNPRIAGAIWENDNNANLENLEKLCSKIKFDLIVLGDTMDFILDDQIYSFLFDFLKGKDIPVCLTDFQDVLSIETQKDGNCFKSAISLKDSSSREIKHLNKLSIIKICPPCEYKKEKNNSVIYWKNIEDFTLLSKYQLKETLYKSLNCDENTKIISMIFNPAAELKVSINENKERYTRHYNMIKDILSYYLGIVMKNNDANCHIFIGNRFSKAVQETKYETENEYSQYVSITEIPLLTYDMYKPILQVSDLIITESAWHPALISSISTETPSLVLGSNVALRAKKKKNIIVSDYRDIDMYVYERLENIFMEDPESIFPYMSYPHKIDFLPAINLIQNSYPYHLTDVFNDERTISLINDILFDKEYQDYYNNLVKSYREEYKENYKNTLSAEKIVDLMTK